MPYTPPAASANPSSPSSVKPLCRESFFDLPVDALLRERRAVEDRDGGIDGGDGLVDDRKHWRRALV